MAGNSSVASPSTQSPSLQNLGSSGSTHTPIPNWPGYSADRDGGIWSASGWRGRSLRKLDASPNGHGYLRVRLTKASSRKSAFVHSLVMATFGPHRPSPAHEVRHLDGDRTNNAIVNLAWGTRKENAADREQHGRTSRGERHAAAIRHGQIPYRARLAIAKASA